VDVVVTISRQNDSISRVVANNLRVLAAGPAYEAGTGRDGKPIQTNVVTLLVTPQDAERLALAQSQGSIVLALRNPMDVEPVETRGVRMAGLLAEPNPEPERRIVNNRPRMVAPTPPPPSRPYTIETIKGTERSQVIIKPPSAGGGGQP
jgi:pilus assembly protein CpaB